MISPQGGIVLYLLTNSPDAEVLQSPVMLTQDQVHLIGERLRKCGYKNLNEYYSSSAWKNVRERKYQATEYKCRCGLKRRLQLHHVRYDNLCDERLEDLVWLCDDCHRKTHGKGGLLRWIKFLFGW